MIGYNDVRIGPTWQNFNVRGKKIAAKFVVLKMLRENEKTIEGDIWKENTFSQIAGPYWIKHIACESITIATASSFCFILPLTSIECRFVESAMNSSRAVSLLSYRRRGPRCHIC